jgi:hypothetical protein
MKKYIFILIVISQIPCFASQIIVGLRSNKLIVKNIWERNNGELKHFLYIYNKTQKEITLEICKLPQKLYVLKVDKNV